MSKAQARRRAVELLDGRGHPAPRRARRRLSAPVLGRHAPARDDRDGALVQSRPPDRRRADDRAGRHDPGADPCPAAQAAERLRLGHHADHARHGRRRGYRRPRLRDVRGPCRRGRPEARVVRQRAAPLHVGAARLDSAHRQAEAAPPDRHPGPAALAALAASRAVLSLRVARTSSRPAPSSRRSRSAPRPGTSTAASCRCPRSSRGARRPFTRSWRRERRAAAHGRGRDQALPGQGGLG